MARGMHGRQEGQVADRQGHGHNQTKRRQDHHVMIIIFRFCNDSTRISLVDGEKGTASFVAVF